MAGSEEVIVEKKKRKFELPNETVEIRHIERPTGMIADPKHVAYGGLMDGSTITLPANKLRNGKYTNVLTKEEKEFLENELHLPENGLSIYAKEDVNYWKTVKMVLSKHSLILDLSDPEDYIKYKQLLSYDDMIAPSLKDIEGDRDKLSYKFVVVRLGDEARIKLSKLDVTKAAYKFLGKIEDNREAMIDVLAIMDKKVSLDTSMDTLKSQVGLLVTDKPKEFVKVLRDPSYNTRVLLHRAMRSGYVIKKGNFYYSKDGEALSEPNQPAILENVIEYLESDMNQEYRVLLKTKLE